MTKDSRWLDVYGIWWNETPSTLFTYLRYEDIPKDIDDIIGVMEQLIAQERNFS